MKLCKQKISYKNFSKIKFYKIKLSNFLSTKLMENLSCQVFGICCGRNRRD